ncbi:MAG: DUF4258 domain-containing protein [Devosia sp.]|nr:DUF4258 domain-containing protein [Devosia sp.]
MRDSMPLRFTQHARDAMAERELPVRWVEAAVRHPDWQEADPHDTSVVRRFRTIPERGGRVLRVALVETDTEIRILSAFLDRRARRPE